jgi:succinate dehydrogenase cytochrome b556 subunit
VHRLSGIALSLYLFLHLYALGTLRDPERFEAFIALTRSPIVKSLEFLLLVAVAAHSINGVRVTLLESGAPTRLQKPLFLVGAIAFCAVLAAGALALFGGIP